MGVDTRILLPADVRVRDVASVIGILAGLPKTREVGSRGELKWVQVDGVKVEPMEGIPEACRITLRIPPHWGSMMDREDAHDVMFHFEPDTEDGRLMIPPSTPFWIAVGTKLCGFFGGKIDFDDCDSNEWDRRFRKPRPTNRPNDGLPWARFQQEMFDLAPVTTADLKRAYEKASYKKEVE